MCDGQRGHSFCLPPVWEAYAIIQGLKRISPGANEHCRVSETSHMGEVVDLRATVFEMRHDIEEKIKHRGKGASRTPQAHTGDGGCTFQQNNIDARCRMSSIESNS